VIPYREIIRLLMRQVREEQSTRKSIARALAGKDEPPTVTDAEVDARIQELQEVVEKNLTKNTQGGKL